MTNNPYYRAALTRKHYGGRMKVGKRGGLFYCEVSTSFSGTIRNEAVTEFDAINATIHEMDKEHWIKWNSLDIEP